MDPWVEAFKKIDKDHSWTITPLELKAYIHENKLENDEMAKKWLSLFDKNNDQKITFKEYCEALGLDLEASKNQIVSKSAANLQGKNITDKPKKEPDPQNKMSRTVLGPDVELITSSMEDDDQMKITEKVRELSKPDAQGKIDERALAHHLKQFLDDKYGRMWHVVVLTGSYWMNYSHEPKFSFQFRLGRYVYLIWRTPAS